MSSYAELYLKVDDNKYLPIGSYSRSNWIYGAMCDCGAKYGKAVPIGYDFLNEVKSNLEDVIDTANRNIKHNEFEIDSLIKMNGCTIEERLESISDLREYIDDAKENIEEIKYTIGRICHLLDIIDDASCCKSINVNDYIYLGIDCGNPAGDEDDY